MNFLKNNWHKISLIVYSVLLPLVSFADEHASTCNSTTSGKICNPLGNSVNSIPELIQKFLIGAIKIGIPIIALAIVYSGFLFVFARGNPEKLTAAKETLLWTLVGAAILLGSWTIATLIQTTITELGS